MPTVKSAGDVAVAAVLEEQVGPVPEPRHWFSGHWQCPHRGVHGPSLRPGAPGAGPSLGGEIGSTGDAGGIGEVAEDPSQCRDRALFAWPSSSKDDCGDSATSLALEVKLRER